MPVYLHDAKTIAFDDGDDGPWVRVDVCDGPRVAVDSSGYPKLCPMDCRLLATWLFAQADRIEALPAPPPKSNAGRKKRRKAVPCE